MGNLLILATSDGVVICERAEKVWQPVRRSLADHNVTSVIAREGVILAGTTEGVFRSDDLGQSWSEASRGIEHRHIRWMAFDPAISDHEFAGSEPAEIYRSTDGGASWQSCPEVADLRNRFGWNLPYSPEAGCVRGFAFHGRRAYAAVEVGGVLVSDDGGQSWRMAAGSTGDPQNAPPPNVHPDVHSIIVHPSSPEFVYAFTGGGFYRSTDGGAAWARRYNCYCRAAWVDPLDPQHILLGPADGVERNGRIEVTRDGGKTWQPAAQNLSTPWPHDMVERFYAMDDELMAVLWSGTALHAQLSSLSWQPLASGVQHIQALTVLKDTPLF